MIFKIDVGNGKHTADDEQDTEYYDDEFEGENSQENDENSDNDEEEDDVSFVNELYF